MPEQKRQTAFKVKISDILSGSYVKEEGWQPNYIIINSHNVSRVNLIGTVLSVQHDPNFSTVVIDDGSGMIPLRSFEKDNLLKSLQIGDLMQVIGRPRQYGSEKYILIEICKKITNPAWLRLRKLELQQIPNPQPAPKKPAPQPKPAVEHIEIQQIDDSETKILECVKKLDTGGGADYEAVLKETKDDSTIKSLLQKGELFEIKPGKLKILE